MTPRSTNSTPTSASPSLPTDSPTSSSRLPDIDAELAAQDAARRAKREARWARVRAVRSYLRSLDDPELRKIAFLLGRGLGDEAVCREARLSPSELQEAKNRLRQGLMEAGAGPEA